jgi:hypothetical protein
MPLEILCLIYSAEDEDKIGYVECREGIRDMAWSREFLLMVCSVSSVVEDRACRVGLGGVLGRLREEG